MDDKENLAKHLEFIQDIIERLSRNSFVLKGWSITVVAACFLLAVRGADHLLTLVVALLPALTFWGLDAFYLRCERMYRCLYNKVRKEPNPSDPFTLDASQFGSAVDSWFYTLWAGSVAWYHGTIVVVVIVALAFFKLDGAHGP